jgi:hypothetical protein
MHEITKYGYIQAKKIDVEIRPSTNPHKKIDVYKNGVKIASIGDINYSDYPTYIISHGIAYANKRRTLYKIRHEKENKSNWITWLL